MHKEILDKKQSELLNLIRKFKDEYYLVGGTAIALHLGHRKSIDFDLFTNTQINHDKIRKTIRENNIIDSVFVENSDELTLSVDQVKITFLSYPFAVVAQDKFEDYISLPSLDTLIAMKSYAIGRRAKFKDYVDIYFYLQNHDFAKLIETAKKIFDKEFNEKLFREQLAYFEDIDYSENVFYLINDCPTENQIKDFLRNIALM